MGRRPRRIGSLALSIALATAALATAQEPVTSTSLVGTSTEGAGLPNAERPLSHDELLAVRGEHPRWSWPATTVVADVAIEGDAPMRGPICGQGAADAQKCALGALSRNGDHPGDPVVVLPRKDRDRLNVSRADLLTEGLVAFVRAKDSLRLVGRVSAPSGTYLTPIEPDAMAAAGSLADGSLIVVRGWLSRLQATGLCPRVPRELDGRRNGWGSPFVRCPGGWVTADPLDETDPDDPLSPATFGIPVQFGALERIGEYRKDRTGLETLLLERVVNPVAGMQPRRGWKVIGRLDALEEIPLPPPRSLDDAAGPTGLVWMPVIERQPPADSKEILTTAWAGGFVSVHRGVDRVMSSWVSPDGVRWESAELPVGIRSVWTVLPLRDGLLLIANVRFSENAMRFEVWRSADGLAWGRSGKQRLRSPAGLQRDRRLLTGFGSLGDRVVAIDTFVAKPCCRSDPEGRPPSRAGNARVERTYVWTSRDGRSWKRRAATGLGRPPRDFDLVQGKGELFAQHEQRGEIRRSTDGVHWYRVGTYPEDLITNAPDTLTRVGSGLVLAGEGPASIGDEGPIGNYLVIWRTDGGSTWERVFEGPNRMPSSIASAGATVVVAGERVQLSGDGELELLPFLLASTDEGRTWNETTEWTDDEPWCLRSLTAKDGAVLLDAGCAPVSAASKYLARQG